MLGSQALPPARLRATIRLAPTSGDRGGGRQPFRLPVSLWAHSGRYPTARVTDSLRVRSAAAFRCLYGDRQKLDAKVQESRVDKTGLRSPAFVPHPARSDRAIRSMHGRILAWS